MDGVANEAKIPLVSAEMVGDQVLLISESPAENRIIFKDENALEAVIVSLLDDLHMAEIASIHPARIKAIGRLRHRRVRDGDLRIIDVDAGVRQLLGKSSQTILAIRQMNDR